MTSPQGYIPRLVDGLLAELFTTFPAVLLTGARATGKTTTALRHADTVIRLDDPGEAAAMRASPDAVLATKTGTVLLDEWQEVPEVLGAVKRAVDAGTNRTRFLLTGSVRAPMSTSMWPGTGRVLQVPMHPVTMAELTARGDRPESRVLERIVAGRAGELALPDDLPDLVGYLELAVRGGYPAILTSPPGHRRRWLDGYLEQVFVRDVALLGEQRDPRRMRRFLQAVAVNTAGLVADVELARAADIDVRTAKRYERLLADLGIVDGVPPWFTNRLNRLVKSPKRYLVDPGLAAALVGIDAAGLLRHGDLMGRLLDTFVAAQLRPLLTVNGDGARLHHVRQQDGRYEVDLLVEFPDGRVVPMEVKASGGPQARDARHLVWLREQITEQFVAGVVWHTGRWIYPLGERITAVPIAALWGPGE